ncbi:MAG: hypothetical protein ACRD36_09945, partial [Candidatus Acidiferrum sp.]
VASPVQVAQTVPVPSAWNAALTAAADQGGNAFSRPGKFAAASQGAFASTRQSPMDRPRTAPTAGANAFGDGGWPQQPTVVATSRPMPATMQAAGFHPSAAPETVAVTELLESLRTALYPSRRESAADRLSGYEWRAHPEIVMGLASAARHDPAPLVRIGCLHSLARMRAACDTAVQAAHALKNDSDARVRQEAESTFNTLQTLQQVRFNR